jgi:hypothetical protein
MTNGEVSANLIFAVMRSESSLNANIGASDGARSIVQIQQNAVGAVLEYTRDLLNTYAAYNHLAPRLRQTDGLAGSPDLEWPDEAGCGRRCDTQAFEQQQSQERLVREIYGKMVQPKNYTYAMAGASAYLVVLMAPYAAFASRQEMGIAAYAWGPGSLKGFVERNKITSDKQWQKNYSKLPSDVKGHLRKIENNGGFIKPAAVSSPAAPADALKATALCNWNHPSIIEKANSLTAGLQTDSQKAKALWNWVENNVRYAIGRGGYWDATASETLIATNQSVSAVDVEEAIKQVETYEENMAALTLRAQRLSEVLQGVNSKIYEKLDALRNYKDHDEYEAQEAINLKGEIKDLWVKRRETQKKLAVAREQVDALQPPSVAAIDLVGAKAKYEEWLEESGEQKALYERRLDWVRSLGSEQADGWRKAAGRLLMPLYRHSRDIISGESTLQQRRQSRLLRSASTRYLTCLSCRFINVSAKR